jgi:hypothetical protein
MGLTIAFDRSAGEQAGLVVTRIKNGTEEEIRAAHENGLSAHFVEWLNEDSPIVSIPGTDLCCVDIGGEKNFAFNANRWGPTYGPLIAFLKSNGVEWAEF